MRLDDNPQTTEQDSIPSEYLALIALKIEKFLDILFVSIEKAGFTGIEFLEKSEMILRSVTPRYSMQEFLILLQVLEEIDRNFLKTDFYTGMITLRQLCTQEVITEGGKWQENIDAPPNLVMFTTHLIENLRQYLYVKRQEDRVRMMDNFAMKDAIRGVFKESLYKTVLEINTQPASVY